MKWLATDPDADAILDFWEAYDQIDPLTLGSWHQTAEIGDKLEGVKTMLADGKYKYKPPPKRIVLPEHAVEHLDAAKGAMKKGVRDELRDKEAQAAAIVENIRR